MKLFSLSKYERLKEKKKIEQLIKEGSSVFSSKNTLKAIYLIQDLSEGNNIEKSGVRIAVGISRKAGVACWRNRLKRLIRNAYRLNKHSILKKSTEKNKDVLILFTSLSLNQSKDKKISYKEIEPEVISLIRKIEKKL